MQLLMEGLLLLIVGMGTVIGFLGLVIGWIQLSSMMVRRFSHFLPAVVESQHQETAAADSRGGEQHEAEQHRMTAAITAALRHYRRRRMF